MTSKKAPELSAEDLAAQAVHQMTQYLQVADEIDKRVTEYEGTLKTKPQSAFRKKRLNVQRQ